MEQIIEIGAVVIAGIFGLTTVGVWLYKKGVHIGAAKVAEGVEKGALALNGVAMAAKGAGLEKVGVAIEEFADVPDELGDVATVVADMTKNGEFTKEKFLELYEEGKDVVVEAKDFVVKVIKKH